MDGIWDVACWGYEIFWMWDVLDVGCSGCKMLGDVGCSECGMLEM